MQLRNVVPGDLAAYIRMRCDPVMTADLGGPLPREGMEDKVRRDARQAADDTAWLRMIVPDEARPEEVAGTVTIWSHDTGDGPLSEIGWMVLPEHQGQGIGKRAVRALLEEARDRDRWGPVHAFPAVDNAASNGICRAVGFRHLRQADVTFAGRVLSTNHWVIDPGRDLR